jgi:shikimate kinase
MTENQNNYKPEFPLRGTGGFFLMGFMGSGKTYWGKRWSEKSGLVFFDIDDMVEEQQGKTAAQIFAEDGEDFFFYIIANRVPNQLMLLG